MYYASYRHLSDEDLASVIVYLRSLKPIYTLYLGRNCRKPFSRRRTNGRGPEPDLSTQARRGRYLTKIGTCIGCHTAFFSPLSPGYFGGGDRIERGHELPFSANLTSAVRDPVLITTRIFHSDVAHRTCQIEKLSPVMA